MAINNQDSGIIIKDYTDAASGKVSPHLYRLDGENTYWKAYGQGEWIDMSLNQLARLRLIEYLQKIGGEVPKTNKPATSKTNPIIITDYTDVASGKVSPHTYKIDGDKTYWKAYGQGEWIDLSNNTKARLNLEEHLKRTLKPSYSNTTPKPKSLSKTLPESGTIIKGYTDSATGKVSPHLYKIDGNKTYYKINGLGKWIDISDNILAHLRLLNFLKSLLNLIASKTAMPVRAKSSFETNTEQLRRLIALKQHFRLGVLKGLNLQKEAILKESNFERQKIQEKLLTKDSKGLNWFQEKWHYITSGIGRHYLNNNEESSLITPTLLENSEYQITPSSFTGDTIRVGTKGSDYGIPENINTSEYTFGVRNRGDRRQVTTEGGVITSSYPFKPWNLRDIKDSRGNPFQNYMGIDSLGNFKVGPASLFGEGDTVAGTYSNILYGFQEDEKGPYGARTAPSNSWSWMPKPIVLDEKTGEKRIAGDRGVGLLYGGKSYAPTKYGTSAGGRVLVKVGNEIREISGSVEDVANAIENMKARYGVDNVTLYSMDNGSYSYGIRTYNGTITPKQWQLYDTRNTSGGNVLYLKDKKKSSYKQVKIKNANVLKETDESYLNSSRHNLTNSKKYIVLHFTDGSQNDLSWVDKDFTNPATGRSAHAAIRGDGETHIYANPDLITFHAGHSSFGDSDDLNYDGIGLEFAGSINDVLTEAQLQAAVEYLRPIIQQYNIPFENIVSHQQVRDNFILKYGRRYKGKKVETKSDLTPALLKQVKDALIEAGVYVKKTQSPLKMFGGLIELINGEKKNNNR